MGSVDPSCVVCGQPSRWRSKERCSPCYRYLCQHGWDKPTHLADAWDSWNVPLLRFMRFVQHNPPCWEWQGCIVNGYGQFQVEGESVRAHRWVWEQLMGPIPEGLHIDHLCRNTKCVFPGHLEPVTPATNTRRGVGTHKTHCRHGHELEGANVEVTTDAKGYRRRRCVECRRRAARECMRRRSRAA